MSRRRLPARAPAPRARDARPASSSWKASISPSDRVAPGQLLGRGELELGLVDVVEEGEELVILALRDRVVLVVVALGSSRPSGRGRRSPVVFTRSTTDSTRNCSRSIPPSWLIGVLRWKPVATFCVERGVRAEVAGELVDGELVERHVAVQGVDDPVAVLPDRARGVDAVAVRVGVAGQVEPGPRPALAVMGRGEQAIDQPLVGVGPVVGQEGVDLRRGRRQADQVEAERGGSA